VFEQYQKARLAFVQSVADLATRPQNIETLQNAGVMALLRPLLLDVVPSVQQTAALALGRLANYSDHLAEAVVRGDILPQLVYSLAEQNVKIVTLKRETIQFRLIFIEILQESSCFCLTSRCQTFTTTCSIGHRLWSIGCIGCVSGRIRSICQRSSNMGIGLYCKTQCWLEPTELIFSSFYNQLKWIFNLELSQHVVDAGAVPLLVLCLQEPEIALKRVSASALSDIAKHSPELAQTIVDAGAIAHLAQLILNSDAQLKVRLDEIIFVDRIHFLCSFRDKSFQR
jgi:hypothetical protein